MEPPVQADWEVEIGGGAPVIEVDWPGFIDLRSESEHGNANARQIVEAVDFPPLADLLLALNAPGSPVWSSKCDLWEPEPGALACYIDLLPRAGRVFAERQQAEIFCREYLGRLNTKAQSECGTESSIDLVIRQAVAGEDEGFGITVYLSAKEAQTTDTTEEQAGAASAFAALMAAFVDALRAPGPRETDGSKLQ
jgi:hypothetical protein